MTHRIRTKLALANAIVFLVAGALLVGGVYVLAAHWSPPGTVDPRTKVEQQLGLPAGTLFDRGRPSIPPISPPARRHSIGQVATDVQSATRSQLLHNVLIYSAVLLAVLALVAFAIGWLISRRSLRPLRSIADRAQTLGESDLHERIKLDGPRDELHELADTFDEMLGRLEAAFAAQRLFVANASHELRTPLTKIRAKLDVTMSDPERSALDLEEMASEIREAIDRSSSLIDSLLTLARSQGGNLERAPVRLDELAGDALERVEPEASAKRIALTEELEPCTVDGDPVLLHHLVENLVSNSIRHNVEGGWARVDVAANDGHARIEVANGGARIEPESLEELFLPLRRGGLDRIDHHGGAGLGLSIVRSVAEAHGGLATAHAPAEGGLVLEIQLPIAKMPA
jgi:signal transduction histidine kinase